MEDVKATFNAMPALTAEALEVLEASQGTSQLRLTVQDHHRIPERGRPVSGAIVAYLADFAMTTAAFSAVDPDTTLATVHLDVDYLNPLLVDDHVLARGKVLQSGGRTVFAEGTIRDETEQVCSRTKGIFRLFPNAR